MAKKDFLNLPDPEFVIWHGNFTTKITTVYNTTFGLTAAQIAAIQNDYAVANYLISSYLPAFKAGLEYRYAFKFLMLEGRPISNAPIPTTPQPIPPATIAVPAAPANAVVPNIKARLRLLARQLKSHANYTAAIGQDLRIIGPEEVVSNNDAAKPKCRALAKPGYQVVITWTRGRFTGVLIESQRAGETAWTPLDKDFRSPFVDTRPPLVPGQPEVRRYRLRYLLGDDPVGLFSDILSVTVSG